MRGSFSPGHGSKTNPQNCHFSDELSHTHLAKLWSHNSWMEPKKFSKHLDAEVMHPVHWQRLIQDCLDAKTNFMDGHLLHQMLCFPVLFLQGFQLQQRAVQAKLDRRILMCISWRSHVGLSKCIDKPSHHFESPTCAPAAHSRSHSKHRALQQPWASIGTTTWYSGICVRTSLGNVAVTFLSLTGLLGVCSSDCDRVCASVSVFGTSKVLLCPWTWRYNILNPWNRTSKCMVWVLDHHCHSLVASSKLRKPGHWVTSWRIDAATCCYALAI